MKVHVLQRRDSLPKLSAQYGVPVCKIVLANQFLKKGMHPGQQLMIPEKSDACSKLKSPVYIVKEGDTIYNLSKRFSTTMGLILKVNSLRSPRDLKKGMSLYIPLLPAGLAVYTVAQTERLADVCEKLSISPQEILQHNPGIRDIYPGMQLVYPTAQQSKSPS